MFMVICHRSSWIVDISGGETLIRLQHGDGIPGENEVGTIQYTGSTGFLFE